MTDQPEVRDCGRSKPHPAHRFMLGRTVRQCPGWVQPEPASAEAKPALRELALDAAKQAINAGGYWLPPAGQEAAVDAIAAVHETELKASQRRAVRIQALLDDTRDRMRKLAAELANGTYWEGNEPEIGERIIAALHQPRETPDA